MKAIAAVEPAHIFKLDDEIDAVSNGVTAIVIVVSKGWTQIGDPAEETLTKV